MLMSNKLRGNMGQISLEDFDRIASCTASGIPDRSEEIYCRKCTVWSLKAP